MIREIRVASQVGLYYLALFGALALPDICGALESSDGGATPAKYKDWLRANVPRRVDDAELIYGLRCSLLHQGRALPHGGVFPIAFMLGGQLHDVLTTMATGDTVHWMSIPKFVDEMTTGTERWIQQYGATTTVSRNLEKFARIRLDGLPPHVKGAPVIA